MFFFFFFFLHTASTPPASSNSVWMEKKDSKDPVRKVASEAKGTSAGRAGDVTTASPAHLAHMNTFKGGKI